MSEDDHLLVDYLRRAYHAVDGLWFMKVEEALGFERALEIDRQVWAILAKIQARKARELTGSAGNSAPELLRCFRLKLTADGHEFEARLAEDGVTFLIRGCPWLELLRKSNRQEVAARIAQSICPTEGGVWCAEFGGEYEFAMPRMACAGQETCEMRFTRRQA